ncbi:MAG: ABC transporter permease [Acidisphaera sp.]|nr:ABC transporter permease [Acidisphaera sp.]
MSGQIAERLPRARKWPPVLLIGGVVVTAIVVLALLGPAIAPYDPTAFAVRARFATPSPAHWFGTDEFGRDVLSRVLAGARYSLVMGFGATAISLALGVPLGLLAALHRGLVEEAIMRVVDLLISIPPVLLGLLILAVTPPSLWKTVAAVGLVYIPIMTRLTRSVALGLLEEDFVQAARARGEGAVSILAREVLPNAWPPIIVESGLRVTFAILLGSSLSFLGLGPQPPSSEWGLMIAESRQFIDQAPWIGLAPGLSLCVLLIAVNLFGEGLREALDPRLHARAG